MYFSRSLCGTFWIYNFISSAFLVTEVHSPSAKTPLQYIVPFISQNPGCFNQLNPVTIKYYILLPINVEIWPKNTSFCSSEECLISYSINNQWIPCLSICIQTTEALVPNKYHLNDMKKQIQHLEIICNQP